MHPSSLYHPHAPALDARTEKQPFSEWLLTIALGGALPLLLAYSLATGSEFKVVAIVGALLAVLAILAKPVAGLYIFLWLVYVRPEDMFPGLGGLRLQLLVSVVTLIGAWGWIFLQRKEFVKSPVVTLLIGYAIVGVFAGAKVGNTVDAALDFARGLIIALLVLNLVRSKEQYAGFTKTLVACTFYLAAYSVYLTFSGQAMVEQGNVRALGAGSFADPNDLAASIIAGLALVLGQVVRTRSWSRFGYLCVAAFFVFAIMLTGSRGGLLALMSLFALASFAFSKHKVASVVGAIILAAALFALAPGRMTNIDAGEESAHGRIEGAAHGIEAFREQPLTGIGYQQFPDINNGFTAHNTFVLCFAELGVVGYFCWMGLLYFAYRRLRPPEEESDRVGFISARLALTGFLIAAFFISRLYTMIVPILIVLPMVQQLSDSGQTNYFAWRSATFFKDIAGICALAAGMFTLIWLMVRVMG